MRRLHSIRYAVGALVALALLLLSPSTPAGATLPTNMAGTVSCAPSATLGIGTTSVCTITLFASAATSWAEPLVISFTPGSTGGRIVLSGGVNGANGPDVDSVYVNSAADGSSETITIGCTGTTCDFASGDHLLITATAMALVPGKVSMSLAFGALTPTVLIDFLNVVGPDTAGIFRSGMWFLNNQNDSSPPEFSFAYGAPGDIPVVGDWDCNGTKTPGVFRNGAWYLTNSKNGLGPNYSFFFGAPGDIPVVGDWQGFGCDTVGVFRNGLWFLTNSITGSPTVDHSFFFGATGDRPVTGNWDGFGASGVGVFRNGVFYLTNAISGSPVPNYTFAFGAAGDIPVTGDWDADSHDSVGIVRAGVWYLTNAITGSPVPNYSFAFGIPTDVPVTGMWGTLASLDRAAPDTQATACAKTFSCQPPPDAWYGAKSLADPKSATLHGWTGLNEPPPPPGWTGPGVPPVEGVPPAKTGLPPTPTPQPIPLGGPGPGVQKGKGP